MLLKSEGGYAQMNKNNDNSICKQNPEEFSFTSMLDEVVRSGAQKVLQKAVEVEVESFLEKYQYIMDEKGHRLVARNGHHNERTIATGAGPLNVRVPRVDDRILQNHDESRFKSNLIPPYLRRTKNMDEFLPFLYLKGVSTGSFVEVLEQLLGKKVPGFSPNQICRLKEFWRIEHDDWSKRDLSKDQYVHWWVDGIHFNVRLEEDARHCILVIIGSKEDGSKELLTIDTGFRESKESWLSIIRNLKHRGLRIAPKIAIGDGALGFWSALEEEYPETKHQLCWAHKTANVLDKLPHGMQAKAKKMIHDIYMAPCKIEAQTALNYFIEEYSAKYPKAIKSLTINREFLLSFYDFPAEQWPSIRTTNVIESTFATVRHRTRQTKGCGTRQATLSMVFKLAMSAEKRWQKMHGYKQIREMLRGARFVNGVIEENEPKIGAKV